jgi:hypothetical protein
MLVFFHRLGPPTGLEAEDVTRIFEVRKNVQCPVLRDSDRFSDVKARSHAGQ